MISTNNHICFAIIKTIKPGDCNLGPTVIVHPLEQLCFSEHRSYHCLIIDILKVLVEGRWDDLIGVDPWWPEQ